MAVAEDHSEAAVPLRNLHPAPATTAVVHRKAAVQAPAAAVVVAEDVNQYFSCVVVLPIRPRRVVGAFFWVSLKPDLSGAKTGSPGKASAHRGLVISRMINYSHGDRQSK
jgi:hypothetical protein